MKSLCGVLILLLLAGCGVKMKESHIFQAKAPDGTINYYKVSIYTRATNSKVEYKSGLYDAEALNALLGEVNDTNSLNFDKEVQRLRRDAFLERAKAYLTAAAPGSDETKAAMNALEAVMVPLDTRPKKFAIIHSSLASVVEEGIANFMEEKESEDLLYTAVAGTKRESYLEAKAVQKQLEMTKSQVFKIYSTARDLRRKGSCNDNPSCSLSLKLLLHDVASLSIQ